MTPFDLANARAVTDEDPLTAFRSSRVPGTSPSVIDTLTSNLLLGKPARGAEARYPEVHAGISAFLTARHAAVNAGAFPVLGEYILRLELDGAAGATWLPWGKPGHLTIWCDALTLCSYVTDTINVQEVLT